MKEVDEVVPEADWSDFEGAPEVVAACSCGETFFTHVRLCRYDRSIRPVSRRPCPNCRSRLGVTLIGKLADGGT